MAFMKKEDVFYTKLKEFGDKVVDASAEYVKIMEGYPESHSRIPQMKVYESECDELAAGIMRQLYSSFITPIDREDISDLTMALDDIVDGMNGVVLRLDLFDVSDVRPEAPQLARLAKRAIEELRVMLEHLPDYKTDKAVMDHAIMVGHIEDEGDVIYHDALHHLFHGHETGKPTAGWLRLFDGMEGVINSCDHAAAIVRSVVLKAS